MAGGDLSVIEQFPKKIDKVIKAMEEHGKAAIEEVKKEKEKEKRKSSRNDCKI